MQVQDLDHLGIVAGIVDQLRLEQLVNDALGTHPQQVVSPGQGIKAMIVNGLGFVSAPLYLYESFFVGKATPHLLGEGIEPEHLNDDYLGRLLDKVWDYGPSQLFSLVAMAAHQAFALEVSRYHLDSSTMSVYGAYESNDEAEGTIEITHGYSKDHRHDLKQFIIELICANDGEVPLAFEVASGNQSDKAVFAERLRAFAEHWDVDGMLVADSALYSEENLSTLGTLRWITRVPLTVSDAQMLVSDLPAEAFVDSERPGYRLSSVCSIYGGINQHWVVVENQTRRESACRSIDKQVETRSKSAHKQLRRQCRIDFECAEDARLQASALTKDWLYHDLADIEVIEHPHYERSGRPRKGEIPTHISYRATARVVEDNSAIEQAKRKAGRFILASNVVDEQQLNAEGILSDYKGQQAPERGFGILKDPLFFTASVFLKTPQRIAALAMIMGLSLMVYTLAQRQLRQALKQANETVADQRKRPTARPTMRWIFQCFQAIHLVSFNGQAWISNLSPERLKILRFLGAPCQKYYLLC